MRSSKQAQVNYVFRTSLKRKWCTNFLKFIWYGRRFVFEGLRVQISFRMEFSTKKFTETNENKSGFSLSFACIMDHHLVKFGYLPLCEWYRENNINLIPKLMNPSNCPQLPPVKIYWVIIKQRLTRTKNEQIYQTLRESGLLKKKRLRET